jgi:hypothetical protein
VTGLRECAPGGYGKRGNPTRNVWREMWKRCTNPRCKSFKWYGARGIAVCGRWSSFKNLLADMGERPAGKSIDRIDVSRGYEPGNCRWATNEEQANNRRNTVRVASGGKALTRAEWVRETGLAYRTIRSRVARGLSLMTPKAVRPPTSKLTVQSVRAFRARHSGGETASALASEAGVSVPTMWKAIVGKTWRAA